MNDSIFAETLAEARCVTSSGRFWLGLLGAGSAIGLAGPFGTFDSMTLPGRMAYWLFVVTATYWVGFLVSFAMAALAENLGIGAYCAAAIGGLAAALPVTALLAGFHAILLDAAPGAEALRLLPYVIVIAVVVCTLSEALQSGTIEPVPSAVAAGEPAWLNRLPAHLGRDLVLLQAQDHYLRAQTRLGETLVRARLQDAASELGEFGLRVHRSWWVARSAIRAYRYRNGAPVVVLDNGLELPVGRSYRRSVRSALK